MSRKYLGFTLIEMLIVMGIMIILMAAGIAGGRFAIQRANRIQKQSATRNFYQASMAYYTDKRQFWAQGSTITPAFLMEDADYFKSYIDAGAFDGGVRGNFYAWVDTTQQEVMFCAQYTSDDAIGGCCEGNGFESFSTLLGQSVQQDMDEAEWALVVAAINANTAITQSEWDPESGWL